VPISNVNWAGKAGTFPSRWQSDLPAEKSPGRHLPTQAIAIFWKLRFREAKPVFLI
jgi:hypothetical protein